MAVTLQLTGSGPSPLAGAQVMARPACVGSLVPVGLQAPWPCHWALKRFIKQPSSQGPVSKSHGTWGKGLFLTDDPDGHATSRNFTAVY